MKDHAELQGEIRYAIRLCQRTARLYRRAQTCGVFLAIVGGSATLSGVMANFPPWVYLSGACLATLAGAALIAIRPADKAAQNEMDARRYQALMTRSHHLDAAALATELEQARQSDAPEVEPLRNVAFNDVMQEINREDQLIPLGTHERLLKALA